MTRRALILAFLSSSATLAVGAAIVAGSALAAGGLYLAEARWMDPGLDIMTVGLGLTALFGALVVLAQPGRLGMKLGVAAAAAVLVIWWGTQLALVLAGPVQTFRGPVVWDIPVWLYSAPQVAIVVVGLPTLAVGIAAIEAILRRPSRIETPATA